MESLELHVTDAIGPARAYKRAGERSSSAKRNKLHPTLKVPPSHGVSSGPNMTACHNMMLASVGVPLMPAGGSFCRRLKSCEVHGGLSRA